MVPKTNRIEDFPDHWKTTLLGDEFWKDAEDWNSETNNKIEAGKYSRTYLFRQHICLLLHSTLYYSGENTNGDFDLDRPQL